mgnify:CR=1 FL=1
MNAIQLFMIVVQLTFYLTVIFFKAIYYLLYYIWRGAVWLLKLLWRGLRALFGWVGDKSREKAAREAEEERRLAQEKEEQVEKVREVAKKMTEAGIPPETGAEILKDVAHKLREAEANGTKIGSVRIVCKQKKDETAGAAEEVVEPEKDQAAGAGEGAVAEGAQGNMEG